MNDALKQPLCSAIRAKIEQQIERTLHLIELIPADRLEWRPEAGRFRVCDLLGHLLDCLAGFCATLYAANPSALAHFQELRQKPVNHCCGIEDAKARIAEYGEHIGEGFALVRDCDLADRLPTVFAAGGEPLIGLLLNNLEHLINHKHQLFSYLKLLGVDAGTGDLYSFREG